MQGSTNLTRMGASIMVLQARHHFLHRLNSSQEEEAAAELTLHAAAIQTAKTATHRTAALAVIYLITPALEPAAAPILTTAMTAHVAAEDIILMSQYQTATAGMARIMIVTAT